MMRILILCILAAIIGHVFSFNSFSRSNSRSARTSLLMQESKHSFIKKTLASLMISTSLFPTGAVLAADIPGVEGLKYPDEVVESQAAKIDSSATAGAQIKKVPLMSKKTAETQAYNDIGRGFKLLRPFGFNEFQGEGAGYLVKFASLYDVDENVVIGSVPASAGKTTIVDYGDLKTLGEKFAKNRGGSVKFAQVRETDAYIFYDFEFLYPVDKSLPRPGSREAENMVELYTLTVAKGRLWSVKVTSNDKLFDAKHEKSLRAPIASFVPRL